ncbi:hypothetical protein LUZ61_006295 [Rhynchospora tenuis]|uniref:DUF8039 domain-containing protein n=1 Tax=Rhynchospora tenuis TaxID=198213 RepID=A0AAD5ZRA1_9POAL|nr:hypothetical protein LUZ61_006295 [Rhynchospora tenuis]
MSNPDENPVSGSNEMSMDDNATSNMDNQTSNSRRGKRSTAKCLKTLRKIAAGKTLSIKFNDKGQPEGDDAREFTSWCAFKTRDLIPLSYVRWNQVPKELKEDLFKSIAGTWNLSPDCPHKQKILTNCNNIWRGWKGRLNRKYKQNPQADAPAPWDIFNIAKEEWEAFDKYLESPTFAELSKKGRENAAKKDMPHTLGSGGYLTVHKRWKEGEVVHGATSTISQEVDSRTFRWSRARASKNPQTCELHCKDAKVAAVIDTANEKLKSGFQPNRQNDLLTSSIGTPEHSGSLRGYPVYSGVKQVFGNGTRKASHRYSNEEIERMLDEKVKAAREEMEQSFSRMLSQSQSQVVYDPILNQATLFHSQGSNNQPHPIPDYSLQEPKECLLLLPSEGSATLVFVARAIVFPRTSSDETVHGEPLGEKDVRVQVLEVFDQFKNAPVPYPPPNADDLLGLFQGSYLRWPMELIDLDISKLVQLRENWKRFPAHLQSPPKKKKKQVELEEEEEEEEFQVEEYFDEGNFQMRAPLADEGTLENLGPNAKRIHDYIRMMDPEMTYFDIAGNFEFAVLKSFHLDFTDIGHVFNRREPFIQVLKVWTMSHYVVIIARLSARMLWIVDSLDSGSYQSPILGVFNQALSRLAKVPRFQIDMIPPNFIDCGYYAMTSLRKILSHYAMTGEIVSAVQPEGKPYDEKDLNETLDEFFSKGGRSGSDARLDGVRGRSTTGAGRARAPSNAVEPMESRLSPS